MLKQDLSELVVLFCIKPLKIQGNRNSVLLVIMGISMISGSQYQKP